MFEGVHEVNERLYRKAYIRVEHELVQVCNWKSLKSLLCNIFCAMVGVSIVLKLFAAILLFGIRKR